MNNIGSENDEDDKMEELKGVTQSAYTNML
jgi:hypothetical protein